MNLSQISSQITLENLKLLRQREVSRGRFSKPEHFGPLSNLNDVRGRFCDVTKLA